MSTSMFTAFLLLFLASQTACHPQKRLKDYASLTLDIVHVNDIHAHLEEVDERLGRCRPPQIAEGRCFGGASRIAAKTQQIRDEGGNVIFLNGGDYYQGSAFHALYGYEAMLEIGNLMGQDALGLGNHDFDDGIEVLLPFVERSDYAVLAANVEEDGEQVLMNAVERSRIVTVDGYSIGLVGYVTNSTAYTFGLDTTLSFSDVVESVREETALLKASGVDMIIAIGHNGYAEDLIMAEQIEDLDVVVGGHSHTFLYPEGEQLPSTETPAGPYPTYVTQASGKVVPVVQAYLYTKYMGRLTVNFDTLTGDLMEPVVGAGVERAEVILLDDSVPKSETVESALQTYRDRMPDIYEVLGVSVFDLLKGSPPPHFEHNLGNVITDSFVSAYADQGATIGFINDSGMRWHMYAGEITGEDIFYVLSFNYTVDLMTVSGEGLRSLLESVAGRLCADGMCFSGSFLQMSGLQVVYDVLESNIGSRVTEMKVRCPDDDSAWCDIDAAAEYTVALNEYLSNGGMGLDVDFPDVASSHTRGAITDYEAFRDYVVANPVIDTTVEGRITVNYS